MAMYRDEEPLRNAVVPRFYAANTKNLCELRKSIAFGEKSANDLKTGTKPRLWHGAKPFLLLSLPRLNYFQINQLIKLSTYIMYGVIGILVALISRRMVVPYLAIMISGILGSGIVVHGGISNALPYLWSLITVESVLSVRLFARTSNLYAPVLIFAGSISAFLYVMDGSLMLTLSLLSLLLYFVVFGEKDCRYSLRSTFTLCGIFMLGFVGSLIFKQLISGFYIPPEAVWKQFIDKIIFRVSGDLDGMDITALNAIRKQFEYYRLAALDWRAYADIFINAGILSWVAATLSGTFQSIHRRTPIPVIDLLVFAIGPAIVFGRYAIIANHSHIHTIIVGRYLFIPFAFGIAALFYTLVSAKSSSCLKPE